MVVEEALVVGQEVRIALDHLPEGQGYPLVNALWSLRQGEFELVLAGGLLEGGDIEEVGQEGERDEIAAAVGFPSDDLGLAFVADVPALQDPGRELSRVIGAEAARRRQEGDPVHGEVVGRVFLAFELDRDATAPKQVGGRSALRPEEAIGDRPRVEIGVVRAHEASSRVSLSPCLDVRHASSGELRASASESATRAGLWCSRRSRPRKPS